MKKLIVVLLAVMSALFLSACSLGGIGATTIKKTDKQIANEKFNEVLEALQSKDKTVLKSAFSEEVVESVETFNTNMDDLFDCFDGEVKSYNEWGGALVVKTTQDDGQRIQIMDSTYDVTTTTGAYRFAIRYVAKDTTNAKNEGVQSLYILEWGNEPFPEHVYWGDGQYTPGININVE